MKKLLCKALTLVLALVAAVPASAQQMPIPVDKDVRIGKLDNGLTYYIRHNEKPKGQADFYIAQKVGSILEEDNQRGLAHFLEHMCFNGTDNFPGNNLIDWLESVGVKFGQNLNAYTSVDRTVYNISNVPVDRTGVIDSCLLILHDWADGLTLADEEIDKERGVIHQEWRRSMQGQMLVLEQLLPVIYPNNRYGERLPIGTMEVVDNFPYQALRDYYEAWYRPDQQGIIVVGDIDPDYIEAKIKEMFGPIKMPENAPERVYLPVEDTEGTIYAIGRNPEITTGIVELMFKTDAFPEEMKGDASYLMVNYLYHMIDAMLNQRLAELAEKPDAPYAGASADIDNFFLAKTKDALILSAQAKGNDVRPALEAAYRELLRAARGGFTEGEYERAKAEYLSRLEKAYNERGNRESGSYVSEYVENFTDNEPIPSIEDEYQLMQMISGALNVDVINQVLPEFITPDNRVLLVLTPENDVFHFPTEAELAEVIAGVEAENIEPYRDEMKAEPLIEKLPKAGKIVAEKKLDQWDATEWTLSNGAKVILKPTKFKDDEVRFTAQALGGTSTLPDSQAANIIGMEIVDEQSGLGTYTASDLRKYLQGKQVSVGLSIDDYDRSVSGSSTVKDLPTLFELIYMNFTNKTITEDEFNAVITKYQGLLKNQEKNPQFIFRKVLYESLYTSPKKALVTPEILGQVDRNGVIKIVADATANAADYTFIFVGNIDLDTFRPLVEQYIASLPGNAKKAVKTVNWDDSLTAKPGKGISTSTTKMETPQTWVFIQAQADMPYDTQNWVIAQMAGQILSNRLLKTVREDWGAVYSIGAQGGLQRQGKYPAILLAAFPMKPEMKQQVLDFIEAEMHALAENVTADELNPIKEFMAKEYKEDLELNGTWMGALVGNVLNGYDNLHDRGDVINAITIDDVKNYMKDFLSQGNYQVVVLDPEEN